MHMQNAPKAYESSDHRTNSFYGLLISQGGRELESHHGCHHAEDLLNVPQAELRHPDGH